MRILYVLSSGAFIHSFVLSFVGGVLCSSLEFAHPFNWAVKQEELWLYKNPHLAERLPVSLLLVGALNITVHPSLHPSATSHTSL